MKPPFYDSSGSLDTRGLHEFVHQTEPSAAEAQVATWEVDPTDLLACGDWAFFADRKAHAAIFYAHALGVIEDDPSALADDTNLSGAYHMYGSALLDSGRPKEAIKPLTMAARIDPRDAITWSTLAEANIFAERPDEAMRCFDRALSLEGIDDRQDTAFFEAVRERRTKLQGILERLQAAAHSRGPRAISDFVGAQEYLAEKGVDLNEWRVVVPCQKRNWDSPMKAEVCEIEGGEQGTYTVVVLNLPYFFGPRWREMTGGRPMALDCESIGELVELLDTMIVKRMVNGALPIPG